MLIQSHYVKYYAKMRMQTTRSAWPMGSWDYPIQCLECRSVSAIGKEYLWRRSAYNYTGNNYSVYFQTDVITLSGSLQFTQVYKLGVPVYLMLVRGGGGVGGNPAEVVILQVAWCYRNWDKFRRIGILDSTQIYPFFNSERQEACSEKETWKLPC